MKIKRKVEMNLPQLIEYIWDNNIKNDFFRRLNRGPFEYVWVNEDSNIEFDDGILFRKNDIFEIKFEEEIDEDTIIPKMLVVGRFDGYEEVYNQKLINFTQHLLSAYIIQDDGHMELIYDEEKGLVK